VGRAGGGRGGSGRRAGYLIYVDGVFTWLGTRLAATSAGRSQRLLVLVFATAAAVTAVLSLDATVVLLTPVVLATAGRLRLPARRASTPAAPGELVLDAAAVSNLTNLLAFTASGLSFLRFTALMALRGR
jgi:arsenical pump membrane protein